MIATQDVAQPARHPFYQQLNRLLDETGFDRFVESLCEPFSAQCKGRPGIPPREYFRMLLVGYFERMEDPTDENLRRFDRKRKGKKVSNREWVSQTDPDARIMKMKDGPTHLAYKAEHAIDLDSGLLLAATIHHGDRADGDSIMDSLIASQANLILSGSDTAIRNVPADEGYHGRIAGLVSEVWHSHIHSRASTQGATAMDG